VYGFGRNTDLGIPHSNFSSKNQSSKVYTSFVEIVVLVTQSTIFGNFYDFIWILQVSSTTQKGRKNLLSQESLELFELHNSTLSFNTQALEFQQLTQGCPQWRGRLAGGDVGPGMGIKRYLAAIRCTRARLGHLVRPEGSSASGGGGAVVAQPRALELQQG
jgi:hypothetical protein